jgi:hypothetical protein
MDLARDETYAILAQCVLKSDGRFRNARYG